MPEPTMTREEFVAKWLGNIRSGAEFRAGKTHRLIDDEAFQADLDALLAAERERCAADLRKALKCVDRPRFYPSDERELEEIEQRWSLK